MIGDPPITTEPRLARACRCLKVKKNVGFHLLCSQGSFTPRGLIE